MCQAQKQRPELLYIHVKRYHCTHHPSFSWKDSTSLRLGKNGLYAKLTIYHGGQPFPFGAKAFKTLSFIPRIDMHFNLVRSCILHGCHRKAECAEMHQGLIHAHYDWTGTSRYMERWVHSERLHFGGNSAGKQCCEVRYLHPHLYIHLFSNFWSYGSWNLSQAWERAPWRHCGSSRRVRFPGHILEELS
jgi:hypothetical protein